MTIFKFLFLLDSFQIILHVFIIYYKHCHVNTLRTYNKFSTIFDIEHEKSSIGYTYCIPINVITQSFE
jgi:hypothetical protein